MISLDELNPHNYETTPETDSNLHTLLERINLVRSAWGKSMTITSGLRSDEQQKELIRQGKSNATKSKHLIGKAVDLQDLDGELYKWVRANEALLESSELWCESGTHGWVHFQTTSPASGHRFFLP